MNSKKFAKNLIDFIYNSPTAFHAVSTSKELLDANGFRELDLCKVWDIKVGGKYYITKNSSAIVAFTVNSNNIESHLTHTTNNIRRLLVVTQNKHLD